MIFNCTKTQPEVSVCGVREGVSVIWCHVFGILGKCQCLLFGFCAPILTAHCAVAHCAAASLTQHSTTKNMGQMFVQQPHLLTQPLSVA